MQPANAGTWLLLAAFIWNFKHCQLGWIVARADPRSAGPGLALCGLDKDVLTVRRSYFTTSTGMAARCITFDATEPSSRLEIPDSPRLPMMISSHACSFA